MPTDDATILSAGYCSTTWEVSPGGDDLTGDVTGHWETLHKAMADLGSRSTPPNCGRILVHYDAAPYPGCSPLSKSGGLCPAGVGIKTFGDGQSAGNHLIIQGVLGPDDKRPVIKLESDQTFLTITHKNWTVENLGIDFDGHGGRGIHVTSDDILPDLDDGDYQQVTENIVIRNNRIHGIRGCKADLLSIAKKADAVLIMGPGFTEGDKDSFIRRVYVVGNTFEDIYLASGITGSCSTDNDHNRDDGFGVLIWPKASDILISGNTMKNISGDAVQCAGISGEENGGATTGECAPSLGSGMDDDCDPWNIEIVDNLEMSAENVSGGIQWRNASENAVDIKSCHSVTIARNKVRGYLGKDASDLLKDAYLVGNVKGGAFVAHYGAENIRVEENDVRDTCGLLGVGRSSANPVDTVHDVLVRKNLFVRTEERCQGGGATGIKLNNADHVDINNNTLVFRKLIDDTNSPRGTGIEVAFENGARADNVDLWNNIIDNPHYFVDHDVSQASNFRVQDNHFHIAWNPYADRFRARDHLDLTNLVYKIDKDYAQFDHVSFAPSSSWIYEAYGDGAGWQDDWSSVDFVDDKEYALTCDSLARNPTRADPGDDIGPRTWNGSAFVDNVTEPKHLGWNQTDPSSCPAVVYPVAQTYSVLDFDDDSGLSTLLAVQGTLSYLNEMAIIEGSGGLAWPWNIFCRDCDIVASVTLDNSNLSGVVARAVDDDTFYGLRLHVGEVIELLRKVDGVHTTLAVSGAAIADSTPYALRLRVRGRHPVALEGWLDSIKVFDLADSAPERIIEVARVGLLSGDTDPTQFDDVIVKRAAPIETVADTLLLQEDFSTCVDDDPPDPTLWSVEGDYYCRSERLRGESEEDLALLHGVDAFNAEIRARVRLNTNANNSGVVARAGSGSYYVARLDEANQVRLERVDASGSTLLAGYSTTIDPDISYRLELRAVGWLPVELDVYLEQAHLISYTDDSPRRLTSGHFGLLSGSSGRTQLDDVYVTAK